MSRQRPIPQLPEGEHALLTAARALVADQVAAGQVGLTTAAIPERISPEAMRLLKQTLAKGCLRLLARRGGWLSEVGLNERGALVRGRLWERQERLPPLRFGAPAFELCRWLGEGAPATPERLPRREHLEIGDELLYSLAFDLTGGSDLATRLAQLPAARRSPLAWLTAPETLAERGPCPLSAQDFIDLTTGAGALVIEALTPDLTRRWVDLELSKAAIREPQTLRDLGAAQRRVLDGLLTAFDEAGRRDLATFLVDAARRLLERWPQPAALAALYRGQLDTSASLSDRRTAQSEATAVLVAISRIASWNTEHRYVRFFDDEYEVAQALLLRWEHLGPRGFEQIAETRREVERLDSALSR